MNDWSALIGIIAEADHHEEVYEPEDLAEELGESGFDSISQTLAVWNDEALVAYAVIRANEEPRFDGLGQVSIELGVHPEWRGMGIEEESLGRAERVAARLAADACPGCRYVVRLGDRSDDPALLRVLARNGFEKVRTFHEMHRPSRGAGDGGQSLPDCSAPMGGVTIRPVSAEDGEAIREAHNDAFRAHWGSSPMSVAEWTTLMESRTTRPAASRIAVDESGCVLSYALIGEWVPGDLYILLVGTRKAHRKQGLAHAVLSELLRAADGAHGAVNRVELDVDSASETDAGRLYTELGFNTVRTMAVYQKTRGPERPFLLPVRTS
ncbi:MAG: GNAT family N-acetyltransferase [Acidipropionibacterium sp.]|nr:GNAT family N-acetyltransferase [Acidipropionibacterium sp.]